MGQNQRLGKEHTQALAQMMISLKPLLECDMIMDRHKDGDKEFKDQSREEDDALYEIKRSLE